MVLMPILCRFLILRLVEIRYLCDFSGGDSSEAMTDLTGGVCEKIQFDEVEDKEGLFSKLQSYFQHHSLGTCSLRNNADGTSQGLIRSHAYTINKVSELR